MFSIMFVSFALNVASPDLTKSLTTLKDAHVLFSAASERIASFSAQEWDSWFRAVTKVQRNYKGYHYFHSLISSHRLSIMRMFFNFLSAQDLLFDAVCDVDVDKVPHYISKLKISSLIVFTACRKFHFQAFPRRVTSAGLSNSSKLTF